MSDSHRPLHYAAVVNPISGRGAASRVPERVQPRFEAAGVRLTVFETEHPHHGQEIVREMDLDSIDGLIAVGGDGTLHDLLNGLWQRADSRRIPLGILPAGAGNSLAFDLGCQNPLTAAERLIRFEPRPVDIAEVRTGDRIHYSFNIIGWGLPADINRTADRMRFLGKHRYVAAALVEILRLQRPMASVQIDGQKFEGTVVFALGCLTRYTGAGMRIAPDAVLDDGLIDLLLVRNTSKFEILRMLPKVFSGSHRGHPDLEVHKVREFALSSAVPGCLNLDGETLPERNCSVRVIPGGMHLLNGISTPDSDETGAGNP